MTNLVTYSPAYTVVPTYECFNRCSYCNFRTDPGRSPWLDLTTVQHQLQALHPYGTIEILVLSGEVHPASPQRSAWFQHIYDICQLALDMGFLPHTNVGPLSYAEMERLKTVNVSMGLMLEQLTPTLLETVHRHAPSKHPALRLQQLQWAGELRIPFTTGLLLGIGETPADRVVTLDAIAAIAAQWGHIQEVILQPYSPGQHDVWQGPMLSEADLLEWVAIARQRLPQSVTLQIPPNLLQSSPTLIAALEAGARDLGGISPHDEVNPDYPHPSPAELADRLAHHGWQLVPRLPIYPQYDDWLADRLKLAVTHWRQQLSHTPTPTTAGN